MNNPKDNPTALHIWIDGALISVFPDGDKLILTARKETIDKATDNEVMKVQRKVGMEEVLTFRLAWPKEKDARQVFHRKAKQRTFINTQ